MPEEKPIKTTVEELRKLVDIQNYIGDPIEVEDKILIPVSKVGVGFGVGANEGESKLSGAGGGASLEPITMVVVNKGQGGIDGIRTIDLTKATETNRTISEIGNIAMNLISVFLTEMGGSEILSEMMGTSPDVQEGVYTESQAHEEAANADISKEQKDMEDVESKTVDITEEAMETVEAVKEEAADTAEEIKEKAEETAEAVKEEAVDTAEEIKK